MLLANEQEQSTETARRERTRARMRSWYQREECVKMSESGTMTIHLSGQLWGLGSYASW